MNNGQTYSPTEPYFEGYLKRGKHNIFYEESGKPDGYPVLFLHGGPGSSSKPFHRRYFDPEFYRIILIDQRGCGKSTPRGEIIENNTYRLIEDLEFLRDHLGIEHWLVFGGSWGSTLAIYYAVNYANKLGGLILRGVFLSRKSELEWYLGGLNSFIPDILGKILEGKVSETINFYYRQVFQENKKKAMSAAQVWAEYETSLMNIGIKKGIQTTRADLNKFSIENFLAIKIQLHYLSHNCFLNGDQLLRDAKKINLPTIIVQGRLDMICPPISAYELSENLSNCELRIIEDGGHSGSQPSMAAELRLAADDMKLRLSR